MIDTTALKQARSDMIAVLDEKFRNVPEWRAFLAIDKALAASMTEPRSAAPLRRQAPRRRRITSSQPSYADLAMRVFEDVRQPVTTGKMVELIGTRRDLGPDPQKARINIQSALSKDKRIESIPWQGGRAWWIVGAAVPKNESAGLELVP